MPIISPLAINPLADGRQSDRAMIVRRGVQRLLAEHGAALLPELPLANGRRADLVAVTRRGDIWIVEIKTSIEDFRTDRKWPEYRLFCDRFFFATHPAVDASIFPQECGFILSDGYGAEILREAPEHRLAAPARKALTLRIARIGAARLTAAEVAGIPVPALDGEAD
ncbi:MAG: MmcB family DNA repair protein [Brucellaceae bacterium]|nr:MmcB family DNA repair protein [Brucellaceae bacterium]